MFPGSFPVPADEQLSEWRQSASQIVDAYNEAKFSVHKFSSQRYAHVHQIVEQLHILVYVLCGYQLIKICHMASTLPCVLHILVNLMLLPSMANGTDQKIPILRYWLDPEAGNVENPLTQTLGIQTNQQALARLVRSVLVVKLLLCLTAHTLFLWVWGAGLARRGQLDLLRNGAWGLISFIGEEPSTINISPATSTLEIVIALGLIELLLTDVGILCIQLVLVQLIYNQSNALVDNGYAPPFLVPSSPRPHSVQGQSDAPFSDTCCVLIVKIYEVI